MPGRPLITSRRDVAAGAIVSGSTSSSGSSGSPATTQLPRRRRRGRRRSGLRADTPVSRQGSTSSVPASASETHRPATKPMRPSTVITLRWLRRIQNGPVSRGGLNTRTSTPASRSRRQNGAGRARRSRANRRAPGPVTPARARSISASAKARPVSSSADDEVFEMDDGSGRADGLEPGRIILPGISQERDRIAVAQVAVGDAGEGPLETIVVAGCCAGCARRARCGAVSSMT